MEVMVTFGAGSSDLEHYCGLINCNPPMKLASAIYFTLFLSCQVIGQVAGNFWTDQPASRSEFSETTYQGVVFQRSRNLFLDIDGFRNQLTLAPLELSSQSKRKPLNIYLPLPDGSNEMFAVWESPIMEPELAARYPVIKTFSGYSVKNPAMTTRFGFTLLGFHAIMHGAGKTALIINARDGDVYNYRSTWQQDMVPLEPAEQKLSCGFSVSNPDFIAREETVDLEDLHFQPRALSTRNLQTYRLAVATTVEYSLANGGTPASVLSAVTTIVNKANSYFEKEHAVRLLLIANTTQTFFFGSASADPYTNGDSGKMLNENPAVLNNAYGSTGYDIGHVFGTIPSGGVVGTAVLASACSVNKAKGSSNVFTPALFYTVVVHELGHQFNATHTFNNCDGKNEETTTAYQPGGGSTFMDYTGVGTCGSNSLQNSPDDYFHINSLERVHAFTRNSGTGQSCAQIITVENAAPQTNIPIAGGFYIPVGTPFQLSGSATDPENGALTYVWEQYDLGPRSRLGAPVGSAPLFRSFTPTANSTRVFPRWENLAFDITNPSEVLPTESRVLTFRFTARDNHPIAGAYAYSEILFNATSWAGPFMVSYPNAAGIVHELGKTMEIKWLVANTDMPPVNCKKVNIKLSVDGGVTFPIMLLANTENDGSAIVSIPNITTSQGRIRVEAADNIFFDISNANFWITRPTIPGFLLSATATPNPVCLPEKMVVDINTESLHGYKFAVTLEAEGLPQGTKVSFNTNPVVPGNASKMTLDFSEVKSFGTFPVKIKGTAPEAANSEVFLDVTLVSSDFSSLKVTSPADGAVAQSVQPSFQWTKLDNSVSYNIEVATSPLFGTSVVSSATNISDNKFTPGISLKENTPYFWRVRASNSCGKGGFIPTATFHTVSQSCTTLSSTHNPINISGIGLPRILSTIEVLPGGTISDLNVKNVKGTHTAVAHIELRLLSPQGDSIRLMPALLCSSNQFNLGFDDQSTLTTIPCPPNTGLLYKPEQALSKFNGRNASGNWSLITAVVHNDGEGGAFTGWSLEVCGASTAKNPYLVKNDTLAVPPNGTRLIYTNKLNIVDDDDGPDKIVITIVNNPGFGFLTKDGTKVGTGESFTMGDILASRIRYTNTDTTAKVDFFTFMATDGKGGFLGTPRFVFIIDPNAPTFSTEEKALLINIQLYPNPVRTSVTVELERPLLYPVNIVLFNAQGKMMTKGRLDTGFKRTKIDVSHLPGGMYWVQMRTPDGIQTKRLLIGR